MGRMFRALTSRELAAHAQFHEEDLTFDLEDEIAAERDALVAALERRLHQRTAVEALLFSTRGRVA